MTKLIFLLTLTFFFLQVKGQTSNVTTFINYVKNDDKEAIANNINFPLTLTSENGSIEINKQDFITLYDEIFDAVFKKEIINSNPENDWSQMGWRGTMFKDGDIWLDENTITGINHISAAIEKRIVNRRTQEEISIYPSLKIFQKNICVLKTKKFLIRIDKMADNSFRYACWSVNQSMSEKPDLILNNGTETCEGSGGSVYYTFNNAPYSYVCYIYGISEGAPANLKVFTGNDMYDQNKCIVNQDAYFVK